MPFQKRTTRTILLNCKNNKIGRFYYIVRLLQVLCDFFINSSKTSYSKKNKSRIVYKKKYPQNIIENMKITKISHVHCYDEIKSPDQ